MCWLSCWAGDESLVMGEAFWGIEGSCFFGAVHGGLVFTSPVNVFSSPSDRLRTELVDMIQRGFITCTPNKEIQWSVSSNSSILRIHFTSVFSMQCSRLPRTIVALQHLWPQCQPGPSLLPAKPSPRELTSFFFFFPISSWPGIEPAPPAVETRSLNYWTTREVPTSLSFDSFLVAYTEFPR